MNPQLAEDAGPKGRPQRRAFAALLRLAGLAVLIVSFFLPAIQLEGAGSAPASPNSHIRGYICAGFASMMTVSTPLAAFRTHGEGIDAKSFLLPLAGLVNPFLLIYLVLTLWSGLVRTRMVFAALILVGFIATWLFFAQTHTTPLIGHFLWVAGAVLLFIPDIANLFTRPKRRPAIS